MPNWCENRVTLRHADSHMINRARKAALEGNLLGEFLPIPQELRDTVAGSFNDPEKQAALEIQTLANVQKYGYANWYDWSIANWGTKWDVGGEDCHVEITDKHTITIWFESAWTPPVSAFERLMEQSFEVEAMYYEPGMAFAGIWDNGHDDCYEYGGLSAVEIEERLPRELDEEFGISDSAAECESESENSEE